MSDEVLWRWNARTMWSPRKRGLIYLAMSFASGSMGWLLLSSGSDVHRSTALLIVLAPISAFMGVQELRGKDTSFFDAGFARMTPGSARFPYPLMRLTAFHAIGTRHDGTDEYHPLEGTRPVIQYGRFRLDTNDRRGRTLLTGLPKPDQRALFAALNRAAEIRREIAKATS